MIKKILLSVSVLPLLLLGACDEYSEFKDIPQLPTFPMDEEISTVNKDFKTEPKVIKNYKKELMKEYSDISDITYTMDFDKIYWVVSWEKKPSEEKMFEVFYKMKSFILSNKFYEDVLLEVHLKGVEPESYTPYYPEMYIDFDLNNDEFGDRGFFSEYNKKTNSLYSDWYYKESPIAEPVYVDLNF